MSDWRAQWAQAGGDILTRLQSAMTGADELVGQREFHAALRLLEDAASFARQSFLPAQERACHEKAAGVWVALARSPESDGDDDQRISALRCATQEFFRAGHPEAAAELLVEVADLTLRCGKPAEALEFASEAQDHLCWSDAPMVREPLQDSPANLRILIVVNEASLLNRHPQFASAMERISKMAVAIGEVERAAAYFDRMARLDVDVHDVAGNLRCLSYVRHAHDLWVLAGQKERALAVAEYVGPEAASDALVNVLADVQANHLSSQELPEVERSIRDLEEWIPGLGRKILDRLEVLWRAEDLLSQVVWASELKHNLT